MDTFSDFIGLLIVILVLLIPLVRRILEKKSGEKEEQEHSQAETQVVSSPSKKKAKKFIPQPSIPSPSSQKGFHYKLESYQQSSAIEQRHIETHIDPHFEELIKENGVKVERKRPNSRLETILEGKSPSQKMVIFQEILNKPRSFTHD